MGGYGSGRRGGRSTVEGCLSLVLDINRIMRPVVRATRGNGRSDGAGVRANSMRFSWTRHTEVEPWAEVSVSLLMHQDEGTATLHFDVAHWSRRTGPRVQRVQIVSTPCRFGGRRWWWLCPATGRRCAKLYLPNGGTLFLSRGPGAYRLAYASQSASAMDRSHNRLARLKRKMGQESGYSTDPLPPRRKWMRTKTYARLVEECEDAQYLQDRIFLAGATRLLGQLERSQTRRR